MLKVKDRKIAIRFNADHSSSLKWNFHPRQTEIIVNEHAVEVGRTLITKNLFFRYTLERQHLPSTELRMRLIVLSMGFLRTTLSLSRLASISTRFNAFVSKNSDSILVRLSSFLCSSTLTPNLRRIQAWKTSIPFPSPTHFSKQKKYRT